MDNLIERLKSLTGPDRTIDEAIHYDFLKHKRPVAHCKACGMIMFNVVPEYTRSIDAAARLVAEGCEWRCGYSKHIPHNAEVMDLMHPYRGVYVGESDFGRAIALCIAALNEQASRHDAALTTGQTAGQREP